MENFWRLKKVLKSNLVLLNRFCMNKIRKTLKALGLIVQNPWKLNHILNQNEEWKTYVHKKYHMDSLPVIPLSYFLQQPVIIEPYSFLEGSSSPVDIALLKLLASQVDHCRYFEIGTWRGESVANVASSAEICYTLDLPENMRTKILNDTDYNKSHRFFSGDILNINHLTADSRTFDFNSLKIKFDLIFIDGDHHYESIVNDTQKTLDGLSHENATMVWHDYGYNPRTIRYETMAAVLDSVPESMHHQLFHVSNTSCAILYRKPVPSYSFKQYALPENNFSVSVNIHPITP